MYAARRREEPGEKTGDKPILVSKALISYLLADQKYVFRQPHWAARMVPPALQFWDSIRSCWMVT